MIGLFLCMYSCFCGAGFLLGFSHRFFPLFFPLVGVGQHLPKSCHCLCPQLCIVCVAFCIGSNYDVLDLVWRALHNPIGSNYDVLVCPAQSALDKMADLTAVSSTKHL